MSAKGIWGVWGSARVPGLSTSAGWSGIKTKLHALVLLLAVVVPGSAQHIDPSSLDGKVLLGYQGWFRCPGGGTMGTNWSQWANGVPSAASLVIDMYPDLREFAPGETCPVPGMTIGTDPANLFSSGNSSTVARHFNWMQQYGLDGVLVQRFVTDIPGRVSSGDAVLRNVMAAAERYGRVFAIEYDISGANAATVTGILQLAALRALAARVEAVTGQVPDTYTITIRPQVTLSGQVDGTAVKDAFSPPLQLNLDRYKLTLPPPGATPDGELQSAQDGPATKQRVANTLSVLGAKLEVQSARRLATVLGLAALAGALCVGLLFLLGLRRADEPARIRARFGHLIVEIAVPRRRFAEHDVVMASFEDLVRVSDRHGRMILHARDGDRHVYLVEDDGIAYRFEAEARPEPRSPDILGGPLDGESPPPPPREPAEH